jgi:tRNA(Ile)-lysidine synthase
MLKTVEQILRTDDLVRSDAAILVAVSGGADSIVLLHLLARLAPAYPFRLIAAHLDHQLRPESAADAEFVAGVCRQLEVGLISQRCDVEALAKQLGTGLEDAGRQARREFLLKVADEQGCDAIALAHHADDQAETVLHRMLRGSGLSGLAAMRSKSGMFIRPLLGFSRQELRTYLQQHGQQWREDVSNADLAFTRNRIRHQLLPQLEQFNPRIVPALNRLSRQAADEDQYWDTAAAAFLERHGNHAPDGFAVNVEPLLALSRAERRRILRAFLRQASRHLPGIDFEHIEQVDALLEMKRPQADLDLPGLWVGRRYDRLLCDVSRPVVPDYELSIDGPGDYVLPTGDSLQVTVGDDLPEEENSALFDAASTPFPLTVRSPRHGDRFQPSGMAGRKRLKDYFIDEKIPVEERRRTPVVSCGKSIIWLAGKRRCELFPPRSGEKLLKITLIRPKQAVE